MVIGKPIHSFLMLSLFYKNGHTEQFNTISVHTHHPKLAAGWNETLCMGEIHVSTSHIKVH